LVWPTRSPETKLPWTSIVKISQSFNLSVYLNSLTKISILSQWESNNGILGISLNSPKLFQITILLWDLFNLLEIE